MIQKNVFITSTLLVSFGFAGCALSKDDLEKNETFAHEVGNMQFFHAVAEDQKNNNNAATVVYSSCFPEQGFFEGIKTQFDSLPVDKRYSIASTGAAFFGLAELFNMAHNFRNSVKRTHFRPMPLLLPAAIVVAMSGAMDISLQQKEKGGAMWVDNKSEHIEQYVHIPAQTYQAWAVAASILSLRAGSAMQPYRMGLFGSLALFCYVKAKDTEEQNSIGGRFKMALHFAKETLLDLCTK